VGGERHFDGKAHVADVYTLKDRIRLDDRKAAAQAAIRYVQLVYGSQLQRPDDEQIDGDPVDEE
jgi:hypothetical protein